MSAPSKDFVQRRELARVTRVVESALKGMDGAIKELTSSSNQQAAELNARRSVTERAEETFRKVDNLGRDISALRSEFLHSIERIETQSDLKMRFLAAINIGVSAFFAVISSLFLFVILQGGS